MKRITIEDVARHAGVSRQTVSRAMNDKGEINAETKERVMEAIRELGYQPNRIAQGMVTQRTKTVGLVMPDITNPFFPEVARGIQDAGRLRDYNVLLCNTDDDPQEEMRTLHSLAAQRVDGIIMLSSSADEAKLRAFADAYSPLVIVNRFFDHPHVNLIIVDNVRGGYLATQHLLALGHRKIGMIASPAYQTSPLRRVQGYQKALIDHGLTPDPNLIIGAHPTLRGGYEAMQQLRERDAGITAIFAYNDLIGLGAIRACRDLGLRVPDDMAIIGYDDIYLSSLFIPSLSSVRVDKYAIGLYAMERLLAMLDHSDGHAAPIQVEVELVVRESTAG